MPITDLTSMATPQSTLKKELEGRLLRIKLESLDYCYQCGKCTSGCEAHKLLELEPHKVVMLLNKGLFDELVNSDIIWTCMSCCKCRERCPQRIAPIEILYALKNMAVAKGKQIPGRYTSMLQSILSVGLIQDAQSVPTKKHGTAKREDLGLPSLSKPCDISKFQSAVMKIATDKI
ncbi:MAG: 4Fe-4S dicluster domain-containing protein [Candidatus Thermoplasmatota archaeon]